MEFSCKEACEILLSHRAAWYQFVPELKFYLKAPECIQCLAGHLADRRKRLWHIAKETLSPRQLAQWKIGENEFPDARARLVMEQVLEAGAFVPDVLEVSPHYEGTYISGNLDLQQFPIFYEAGFREINHRSSVGLLPLAYANTGSIFPVKSGASEAAPLQREMFSWLKNHSYLDQSIADSPSLGFNTSATGWHFVARSLLPNLTTLNQDPVCQFFYEFLRSRSRDSCKCWCSPHGCLPCTIWLKDGSLQDPYSLLYPGLLNPWLRLENAWRQVSTDLLTHLTFEALEMTHTCCYFENFAQVPLARRQHFNIKQFPGNVHEIQEEEEELGARLEYLVQEFQCKLDSSQRPLREFIYGYWSERMADECLPNHENMEVLRQAGVNVDEICKSPDILHCSSLIPQQDETPTRLRWLLGSDFDFKNRFRGRYGSIFHMDNSYHPGIPGSYHSVEEK